jgi:hypothetical protein
LAHTPESTLALNRTLAEARFGQSGVDGVHPYSVAGLGELKRRAFAEISKAALCGGVAGQIRRADDARDRTHVDDRAAIGRAQGALLQKWKCRLGADEGTFQIDPHQEAPVLDRRVLDRLRHGQPDIVDEDVEIARAAADNLAATICTDVGKPIRMAAFLGESGRVFSAGCSFWHAD